MPVLTALVRKSLDHSRNLGRVLRRQSAFKIVFTLCFAAALEYGLFRLFLDGFAFLHRMGGVGLLIVNRLFALFFLGMGAMLATSNMVTTYTTLYRSDEIPFLLVRPFRMSQISLYKFLEATGLSSWAFFFIIIPFVWAFAWHEKLSPWFSLWTLLFSLPFLVICSGVGTILTMLLVRLCPRGRFLRIPAAALFLLAGWGLLHFHASYSAYVQTPDLDLTRLIPGLTLAAHPLLPSWWVSEGLLSFAGGYWFRGLMFLALLLSSAVVMGMAIECLGEWLFYTGWLRVSAGNPFPDRAPVMLKRLRDLAAVLPGDIRAVILKDIRTFLRDPMQWSQVVVFFGLLGLYYANIRIFRYHVLPDNWRNTVAFLNVFSVAAVVCSLGSRFIYPQLSLEGQGFWVLGLSPTSMTRILLAKFSLSAVGMLIVSVVLMLLSSSMLNVAPVVTAVAVVLACAIALAVCALSTGLGAIFLDLDQKNPAAIVSGFGGTLNLVLCLGFMLAAILPFGLVFHAHLSHRIGLGRLHAGLGLSFAWLLVLTLATVILPLWIASRSLRRREF